MNFRYKLMQFMRGRYGVDNLFYVLITTGVILSVVNVVLRSLVLQLLIYAVIIYAFFRTVSRNIEARRRENQSFKNLQNSIIKKRDLHRQRKADYTHIYKKCPHCRAVLRLPRRKGKHTTVCPRCNKEFKVRVFRA